MRVGNLLKCRTPFIEKVRHVVEVDWLDNAFQASVRPAGIGHVSGIG
jgi:hypothetical protein